MVYRFFFPGRVLHKILGVRNRQKTFQAIVYRNAQGVNMFFYFPIPLCITFETEEDITSE